MLIFIDESGDTGNIQHEGSSPLFFLSAVTVSKEEAYYCENAVSLLKKELQWPIDREFHFKADSHSTRIRMLNAIAKTSFRYSCLGIQKNQFGPVGDDLYLYAIKQLLLRCSATELVTVILDQHGGKAFKNQVTGMLRNDIPNLSIKKLKVQSSRKNTILQVADYVVGSMRAAYMKKKANASIYRDIIQVHEEQFIIK